MAIRGLDAVSGEPVFIKSFSGLGSEADPYVMQRADPIAHTKLDEIKVAVNASSANWLYHSNFGTTASANIKNTSGRLRSFIATNEGTETCYLLFFNLVTVPNDSAGDLAIPPFSIHSGMTIGVGQSELGSGFPFTTGITYGISSSRSIYTAIATAADIRLLVGYQ